MNALGYALFALAAGCMLPLQAGINAVLAQWVGGPVRASLVSFVVGTIVLLTIAPVLFRGRSLDDLGRAPWWCGREGFSEPSMSSRAS